MNLFHSTIARAAAAFVSIAVFGCQSAEPTAPVSEPSPTAERPFVWSAARGLREIPVPARVHTLIPAAINDAGEVAGMVMAADGRVLDSFVWSESKGLRRWGMSTISSPIVTGINSSGLVVGRGFDAQNRERALAWKPDVGFVQPTQELFSPYAVNDAGSIVGTDVNLPMRWDNETQLSQLKSGDAECTAPVSITNSGDILEWLGTNRNGFGCFSERWRIVMASGSVVEILVPANAVLVRMNQRLDLAGNASGSALRQLRSRSGEWEVVANATANDMNDDGDIALVSAGLPYVWAADGALHSIPLLPGTSTGRALGINNKGEVVGWMQQL